ncbi:S-layer protein domain-containing protein, partial [Methanohalophilus sp.]|uniref:S-layer protein domain-containing protein n=1 Tax=Methanohalophilus sp. TaxID=1966352 RepID=UPI00260E71F9
MKKLLTFAVAALMVLAAVGAASAAITVDSVEIRGPIYNGSDIDNIVATYGNGDYVEVTATNFAGFWYDIDENDSTEVLRISNASSTDGRELAEEYGLTYITYINETAYEGFEGNYNIIGFFAEPYVPLTDSTPDKLAKLMFDDDEKYTLRVGESLD